MDNQLSKGDVVTTNKGKRKGKKGRLQDNPFNDTALVIWQNGYSSISKVADLVKVEGEAFVFDWEKEAHDG